MIPTGEQHVNLIKIGASGIGWSIKNDSHTSASSMRCFRVWKAFLGSQSSINIHPVASIGFIIHLNVFLWMLCFPNQLIDEHMHEGAYFRPQLSLSKFFLLLLSMTVCVDYRRGNFVFLLWSWTSKRSTWRCVQIEGQGTLSDFRLCVKEKIAGRCGTSSEWLMIPIRLRTSWLTDSYLSCRLHFHKIKSDQK